MKFGERKQTQGAQQAQEPWSETAGNAPRTAGDAASNGSEIRGGRGGSRSSGSEYGSASGGENPQAANACGETAEKPKFRLFTGDRVLWIIIAVLAVCCILTLAVFAVRCCRAGRSSFYTIAACAATSMMVFQTCLNVLGAVDILPLTGVTFPFVSNGGSSMLSSWGLLAFLKATDTRQNASFAIRLPNRRKERADEERLARRPAEKPEFDFDTGREEEP